MTLIEALAYFFREAAVSALRNWRASAVAVLTCALSLYVGSFFFLVGNNIANKTRAWEGALRINVYLEPGLGDADVERLRAAVQQPPWIAAAEHIDRAQAAERFRAAFPGVAGALGDSDELDLPASIEGTVLSERIDTEAWEAWIAALAADEAVSSVDDDRDWIRDLQQASVWARTAGAAIGLALLVAAAFTIAAVVRLTAYQYLDEISVLRLVGATEFFVRGPFVVEGLLQGLAGALLGLGALWLTFLAAAGRAAGSLWTELLFDRFLSVPALIGILLVGALAGLTGSVLSIRREALVVLDEQ